MTLRDKVTNAYFTAAALDSYVLLPIFDAHGIQKLLAIVQRFFATIAASPTGCDPDNRLTGHKVVSI